MTYNILINKGKAQWHLDIFRWWLYFTYH